MKNTKRVLAFLVGAAMMLPMASAEGTLASGDYEATSQGFGGAVTVKVTVTDGKVTAATITGDKETEAIGGAAIKTLTEKLIGVSSADEVDTVASATVTSNAVKAALADCLRQAAGEEKAETALVDGVYTGEGSGFNLTQKVQVTVEIKDGKIASVTVGDNGETMGMIAAVEDKWIPRVVENQSLAVDAICGATASSNGVRAAVVNALESAGMDVSGLYTPIAKVDAAEEYNVDIVVVGMGSSGTTAALRRRNPARMSLPSTRLASGEARAQRLPVPRTSTHPVRSRAKSWTGKTRLTASTPRRRAKSWWTRMPSMRRGRTTRRWTVCRARSRS